MPGRMGAEEQGWPSPTTLTAAAVPSGPPGPLPVQRWERRSLVQDDLHGHPRLHDGDLHRLAAHIHRHHRHGICKQTLAQNPLPARAGTRPCSDRTLGRHFSTDRSFPPAPHRQRRGPGWESPGSRRLPALSRTVPHVPASGR